MPGNKRNNTKSVEEHHHHVYEDDTHKRLKTEHEEHEQHHSNHNHTHSSVEAAAVSLMDSTATTTSPGTLDLNDSKRTTAYDVIATTSHHHGHSLEDFNHNLFHLLLFRADHKSFHVPRESYPELYAWMQHLKREYKHYAAAQENGSNPATSSSLTPDQLKVLQSLHIPLTSRGDDHWNRFYQLLQDYRAHHGHVLVPRLCEIPGLGDWVTDQRRQYKALKQGQTSQLTNERRDKLEHLGFVWQVRNRPEWETRYHELEQYKHHHGDCKVPQHYKPNRALGKWVAKQREQYKLMLKGQHSFLTPYRLEKLNALGFVWQVRSGGGGSSLVSGEQEQEHVVKKEDEDEEEHQQEQSVEEKEGTTAAKVISPTANNTNLLEI